jgi:hypothetical protein
VLDTRWCNGSMRGSEPLGLGSNPGWVAMEGSAEWSASGLESRAGVTPRGSIPLLSSGRCGAWAPPPPLREDSLWLVVRLHLLPLSGCWDTREAVTLSPSGYVSSILTRTTGRDPPGADPACKAGVPVQIRHDFWATGVNGSTGVLQASGQGSIPWLSTRL